MGPLAEFKVVVLGDKGVGKTSLVLRHIEGHFSAQQQSTIGAFFLTKKVTFDDGSTGKMQLWDTAGQERFKAMAGMYYRGADAAIVCYDIGDDRSFIRMKDWVSELLQYSQDEGRGMIMVICCTKIDRPDEEKAIPLVRGREFAASLKCNAAFFETSAKRDEGIRDLFKYITEQVSVSLLLDRNQHIANR